MLNSKMLVWTLTLTCLLFLLLTLSDPTVPDIVNWLLLFVAAQGVTCICTWALLDARDRCRVAAWRAENLRFSVDH